MNRMVRESGWAIALTAAFLAVARGSEQPTPEQQSHYAWKEVAVGSAAAAQSRAWDDKSLKVIGSGGGVDVKGTDQVQFVYLTRDAADFEIVAHLADFSGEGEAGIMARGDNSPDGAMTALFFNSKDNSASWRSRVPSTTPKAGPRMYSGGIRLAPKMPLWLKVVRMGKNFAVYKSRDGRFWSMVSNTSGGPIALDGAVELGFFAAGGAADKLVTATFDSIRIGAPRMGYTTTWVGNTFGCETQEDHVSNGLSAMWVAADGTCFTSSYWDEAGRPVTSYRDGKVLRGLPIGTPQTAEGGITGDAGYVYVAAVDHVVRLDPSKSDFSPTPLILSVNFFDKKNNNCSISGMASDGKELFVADSLANLVRVASAAPVPTYQVPMAANDGIANAPAPVEVPENVPGYAPPIVYQSQRIGEGYRYTLPGFKAGLEYTVRCHFAEYVKRAANCDKRNRVIGIANNAGVNQDINVADLAGGIKKACFKDFTGFKADANGNVVVNCGSYGGPGLCGLEVLGEKGERLFAINCGGVPVGDFKGETQEFVSRAFHFDRPGSMAIDKRGDLWIIQRANDFPANGYFNPTHKASVRCHKSDGTFTGREIALAYDAAKDQLLVGENGEDLNVRIYGNLDTKPTLARTFGQKGGIYSGAHPGLVADPSAGGYARFAGIAGLGVDARGNLYVGGGFQGTDLRRFTPDGTFDWMLNSHVFCNTYDVDPASDGADIYATYNHLKLDLSKPDPEQKYIACNWDLRNFGSPVRVGNSQSILRRLGPDKRLFMFTSGQGNVESINIYRYDGDLAIPCGGTRQQNRYLWIDADGDGKEQPQELAKLEGTDISSLSFFSIDSRGDIWAAAGNFITHFPFKGINDKGVPIYSAAKSDGFTAERFPEEGGTVNPWGMGSKVDYDADRDILVAFYPAVPRTGEGDTSLSQYYIARYDNWSKGNRAAKWKIRSFNPETHPGYFMYETRPYPFNLPSGYMGMQGAGDYLFLANLWGEVHVLDLETGKLVEILSAGPEVGGMCAWEDATLGLRAFKRKNGEYLIFTENSGWGGKNNVFRWTPGR